MATSQRHPSSATNLPHTYTYSLTADQAKSLTKSLLQTHPPTVPDRLILYLIPGPSLPHSNLARHVETSVFATSFNESPATMHAQYSSHESVSTFLLAVDAHSAQPAGVLRVIHYSQSPHCPGSDYHHHHHPFITLRDAPTYTNGAISMSSFCALHSVADLSKVWEIGSLAVLRAYRSLDGHLVSSMLYRALSLHAGAAGVRHLIGIVDAGVYAWFARLGLPFEPICGSGSFAYGGTGEDVAVCGVLEEFAPAVVRRLEGLARARKKDMAGAVKDGEGEGEKSGRAREKERVLEVFVRRALRGEGVDHRFMFEVSGAGMGTGTALTPAGIVACAGATAVPAGYAGGKGLRDGGAGVGVEAVAVRNRRLDGVIVPSL